MAKCVFCEQTTSHADTCPMVIPTPWGPGTGVWPVLARNILEAWRRDSCVYDRGGSEDIARLEALWSGMEWALDQGHAEVATALLFGYYEPPQEGSSEGPVEEGPTEGPSQEGPSQEGPV